MNCCRLRCACAPTTNGDVCNTIGTCDTALAARDNAILLYVALHSPTIDRRIDDSGASAAGDGVYRRAFVTASEAGLRTALGNPPKD